MEVAHAAAGVDLMREAAAALAPGPAAAEAAARALSGVRSLLAQVLWAFEAAGPVLSLYRLWVRVCVCAHTLASLCACVRARARARARV